jgi:hypothetical protein
MDSKLTDKQKRNGSASVKGQKQKILKQRIATATSGSNATKALDHTTSSSSKKRKRKSNPLNGLILAISTQEKNKTQ